MQGLVIISAIHLGIANLKYLRNVFMGQGA